MYRTIKQSLVARIQAILAQKYSVTLPSLAVEQPPNIALGELALPVAFELAKRLRKAPRAIATELAAELSAALPEGIASVEAAGAGYLNIRFDRTYIARHVAQDKHADIGGPGFRLVEHTSINPNKAAHIGHLRNAILGDTFQRLLRPDAYKRGYDVGVQNYIDNTGVQVADVVVGLMHLENLGLHTTRALLADLSAKDERIDFYCWDLYARVSQWYTADPEQVAERKALRLATLHAIEHGGNEVAEVADLIATAVLRRHLETMQRLDIEYDFLPRESEILHLHFWDAARQLMIERGVLYLETEGKNKGCWVMRRALIN
jgi:arginyl-tRNA synthetase